MSNQNEAVLTTEIAGVQVELALTNLGSRIQLWVQSVNGEQPSCNCLFGIALKEDRTQLCGFLNPAFLTNNPELNKYVARDAEGALSVDEVPTWLPFSDLIVEEPEDEEEWEDEQCDCEYCQGYRAGLVEALS